MDQTKTNASQIEELTLKETTEVGKSQTIDPSKKPSSKQKKPTKKPGNVAKKPPNDTDTKSV